MATINKIHAYTRHRIICPKSSKHVSLKEEWIYLELNAMHDTVTSLTDIVRSTMELNDSLIEFQIDTGAETTIIPEQLHKIAPHFRL